MEDLLAVVERYRKPLPAGSNQPTERGPMSDAEFDVAFKAFNADRNRRGREAAAAFERRSGFLDHVAGKPAPAVSAAGIAVA